MKLANIRVTTLGRDEVTLLTRFYCSKKWNAHADGLRVGWIHRDCPARTYLLALPDGAGMAFTWTERDERSLDSLLKGLGIAAAIISGASGRDLFTLSRELS